METDGTTIRAIDIVMNPFTPEFAALRPDWSKRFLSGKVKAAVAVDGIVEEELAAKLDRAGVVKALLVAARAGSTDHRIHYQVPYRLVAREVERHPDRFRALAGIDPTTGMRGVRELEHAVRNDGFVGAHLYPHWFEMAPDHARYYPFYAKCVELDIPIQIQVGHCLVYSTERPLPSVGRPITLDTVACDFPELKIIGIHIGWPWTEEMISVAYKHRNVYIGSDAYAPHSWPQAFVHYINTWGQDKVLFGTDFPVIDTERAIAEIKELNLRPSPLRKLLFENAARLYRLDD